MIRFILPSVQAHTAVSVQHRMPEDSDVKIEVITLAGLAKATTLAASTYIFGGLEKTSGEGRALACAVWDQLLQSARARLLNDPNRYSSRYELLLRFLEAGLNRHRAYHAMELASVDPRYPVFIRRDSEHSGALTDLLYGREEVERALQGLIRNHYDPDDLIVMEFVDTADEQGVFRKYSACKVGSEIFACNLDYSDYWIVKRYPRGLPIAPDDPLTQRIVAEEFDYVSRNPHASILRRAFELAELDYARIDYSIVNGEPCFWEINSAPGFGRPPTVKRTPRQQAIGKMRLPAKEMFNRLFAEKLKAIESEEGGDAVPIVIPDSLRRSVASSEAEAVKAMQRSRCVRRIGKLVPRWRMLAPLRIALGSALTKGIHRRP